MPDCPEPIVNPFGQTRLQVYGMLGAQRVNMWSERRERRRRKQAIIDSEDDEIASSEDDVQHDKSVKTGTRSKTLNLEDDPIESTAEPLLQREPSMPAPGALQLNGDDEPVQSQLTAREEPPNVPVATSLPPNFRVEEESISSALEKEPEVPPEDGPIPNAVLSNSDPPITNTAAAPRFPTKPKSTFLTGQGHRSVISKNASAFQTASDSDEDDFPSIPIVPLGRAIPARLPPTTRNVLAPEKEQNKALGDPNSRNG